MEYQGQARLIELIETHSLSRAEVARMLNGSLHTVNSWLRKDKHRRNIPTVKLQLLELLLEEREKR